MTRPSHAIDATITCHYGHRLCLTARIEQTHDVRTHDCVSHHGRNVFAHLQCFLTTATSSHIRIMVSQLQRALTFAVCVPKSVMCPYVAMYAMWQVTDTRAMERAKLDRLAIMESVCRSFAYQVHILGRFNGDPHPGESLPS